MKQLALLFGLLVLASTALAKNVTVKTGVSYWYTDSQGSLSAPDVFINDSTYKLSLNKKSVKGQNNGFAYLAIENSIKGVPNFRLSYNHLKSNGKADFIGIPVTGGINFTHYDLTTYYKVFSKKIDWDLGLTARKFNGDLTAKEFNSTIPLDKVYGLIYSDLKIHVFQPEDGFLLGLQTQFGKTGKEEALDISAYFQYTLPEHIGITWGFRFIDVDLKTKGKYGQQRVDVKTQYKSHGPFLGLHLHF